MTMLLLDDGYRKSQQIDVCMSILYMCDTLIVGEHLRMFCSNVRSKYMISWPCGHIANMHTKIPAEYS